jgi:hypothetical protein
MGLSGLTRSSGGTRKRGVSASPAATDIACVSLGRAGTGHPALWNPGTRHPVETALAGRPAQWSAAADGRDRLARAGIPAGGGAARPVQKLSRGRPARQAVSTAWRRQGMPFDRRRCIARKAPDA